MKETLCWSCRRPGTRSCAWDDSKATIPVDGWTAERKSYPAHDGRHEREVVTYRVIDCPAYIPDRSQPGHVNYISAAERERAFDLIRGGASVQDIMREFSVSADTARDWTRKALHLPARRGRKRKEATG